MTFERATQAAVAREGRHARILDIRAGSGLLSMMAARAGAANIVACERVLIIAGAAERIVALNGLDRAIRVINKASSDLLSEETWKAQPTFWFRKSFQAIFWPRMC